MFSFVVLCLSKSCIFYLCYFLSLFELCEESLSAFRYNRSLSVGRYHIVVISPFLSRFPLSFSSLTFFLEFLVVFLDCG